MQSKYIRKIEKENAYLKDLLHASSNSEREMEDDFIRIAQALEGNIGEELGGEPPMPNDPNAPAGDDASVPDELEQTLSAPDEQRAEVIEWDSFSIVKSDEYSNKLQQEQGLSVRDADTKSFYIRYKTSDELLAIQGQIFGANRDKGEGLKNIGGFNTKEELGKDLEFMKDLWETGFPTKEKDNLLVTIDELSPALEAFQAAKESDQILEPEEKEPANSEENKEEEKVEEPEETEDLEKMLADIPEGESSKSPTPKSSKPSGGKTSPVPKPVPLGRANLKEIRITHRAERLQELRKI